MTDFGKLKDAIIELMIHKSRVVLVSEREKERWPDAPNLWVSPYGWEDYTKNKHVQECGVVVPEDSDISEVTYSEFMDTFTGNRDEIGLNAYSDKGDGIHCNCMEYDRLHLRYIGSLGDVLRDMSKLI